MTTLDKVRPWETLGISKTSFYRKKRAGLPLSNEDSHKRLINEWVAWRESGLMIRPWSDSHKTLQLYYASKYFDSYEMVSAANLESWLAGVPTEQYSKRKHQHSTVSSFAKFLRHRNLIDGSEYLRIRALAPKRSPYQQPNQRIIYEEDLTRLIAQAAKGYQRYQRLLNVTLLIFLSETGLRVSEACNLIRSDLRFSTDPKSATVFVKRGKGGKSRIVPFSKRAQQSIAEYLADAPDGERLFYSFNPNTSYKPLDRHAAARRFQALAAKTGIDFCPHSLRHYRITKWANNPNIPIAIVQRWAGHSSLEITQRYIHIRDEDALRAAYE